MGFTNGLWHSAFSSRDYICSKCGAIMEFEDEWEDTLVCPECGHDVDIERYGLENDEDYDALYPPMEPDEEDGKDEDYTGEVYDEVCGELDDYVQ